MDPLEQSHIALRGDVDSMKNQLDQLVEAMTVLANRKTSSTLAIVGLICFYFCICSFFVVKSCLCLNIVVFNGNIDEVMMHVLN